MARCFQGGLMDGVYLIFIIILSGRMKHSRRLVSILGNKSEKIFAFLLLLFMNVLD